MTRTKVKPAGQSSRTKNKKKARSGPAPAKNSRLRSNLVHTSSLLTYLQKRKKDDWDGTA